MLISNKIRYFFLAQGPMLVDIESSDEEHSIEISGKVKIRASDELCTGSPKPKDQKYVYQRRLLNLIFHIISNVYFI